MMKQDTEYSPERAALHALAEKLPIETIREVLEHIKGKLEAETAAPAPDDWPDNVPPEREVEVRTEIDGTVKVEKFTVNMRPDPIQQQIENFRDKCLAIMDTGKKPKRAELVKLQSEYLKIHLGKLPEPEQKEYLGQLYFSITFALDYLTKKSSLEAFNQELDHIPTLLRFTASPWIESLRNKLRDRSLTDTQGKVQNVPQIVEEREIESVKTTSQALAAKAALNLSDVEAKVWQYHLQGYGYGKIAQLMRCPKSRIQRIVQKIRDKGAPWPNNANTLKRDRRPFEEIEKEIGTEGTDQEE